MSGALLCCRILATFWRGWSYKYARSHARTRPRASPLLRLVSLRQRHENPPKFVDDALPKP